MGVRIEFSDFYENFLIILKFKINQKKYLPKLDICLVM